MSRPDSKAAGLQAGHDVDVVVVRRTVSRSGRSAGVHKRLHGDHHRAKAHITRGFKSVDIS